VALGINGISENTKIEIDHKDGRKNDLHISDLHTQKIDDFQPLCKAANEVKRQICKKCKETDKRWDAKNLKGIRIHIMKATNYIRIIWVVSDVINTTPSSIEKPA
jgi:hypothetical protein